MNNAFETKWVRTIAFVAVGDATGAGSASRERDALLGELDGIEPELLQHTKRVLRTGWVRAFGDALRVHVS